MAGCYVASSHGYAVPGAIAPVSFWKRENGNYTAFASCVRFQSTHLVRSLKQQAYSQVLSLIASSAISVREASNTVSAWTAVNRQNAE